MGGGGVNCSRGRVEVGEGVWGIYEGDEVKGGPREGLYCIVYGGRREKAGGTMWDVE